MSDQDEGFTMPPDDPGKVLEDARKYSHFIDNKAEEYCRGVSLRETEVQVALREFTDTVPRSFMISGPLVQSLLQILIKTIGATKLIEVGVYTGSGALAMALALPSDGKLIAIDNWVKTTEWGPSFWERAGVSDRIEFKISDAQVALDELIEEGGENEYDFAFVDADKTGYRAYYEKLLTLVHSNGLIVFDNTLWDGKVWNQDADDVNTLALRELNEFIHSDERVDVVVLPFSDGVTICRVV